MSTGFVITRADGSQRPVRGYKFAAPRPGTKRYAAERLGGRSLPPRVDLRPQMTLVEDQRETSSCVANAVAGAYEYLVKRHRGDDAYDVSRLFIYYNARAVSADGEDVADEGSNIGDAIEGLTRFGACAERTWPFDEEAVNDRPSDEAFAEAERFLVEDVELVPLSLDAWRGALAEGNPIVFGISLFESFDAHRKKGLVPVPSPKEASRESHGGHAMLCVGYSDKDQLFVVRNSWGTDWGDAGYCYIPYGYLMSERWNDGDSWIIRRLENVELDEGTWGDDTSIVTDVGHELAQMSDDDFSAMLDAMGEHTLPFRLGLVFLHAANADEDLADVEIEEIATYLSGVLEQIGVDMSPQKILRNCMRKLDDEGLLEESVELLGTHLSKSALAGILNALQQVVASDQTSDEEQGFVDRLVQAWQVEEGDRGEDEEEEEENEDEDEDEDEDDGEDDGENDGEDDGENDGEDDGEDEDEDEDA